jgi:glycosyltransferase involved in cell wall biosynthesis
MNASDSEVAIIVGIPAFNVEGTIAKVVVRAKQVSDQIVVCDDGSSDDTRKIAESLGCKVVSHEKNLGYGAALRTLIDVAREGQADVLVTIDGDGQHDPKEILVLADPIIHGRADLVIGTRFGPNGSDRAIPLFRKLGIRSITWLVESLSKQKISDAQSGFRAYGKKALACVRPGEQGMGASTEILLTAKANGLRILEVPCTVRYGNDNESTHNPIFHFADVIGSTLKVAAIRHPLLYFGLSGLIFLLTSLSFALWALNIFSQEGRLVTNLALISIGTAIIGTILASTGVLLFTVITVLREHSTSS